MGNFISSTYEPIAISYLGCNFSVSEDLKISLQFDKIKKRNKSHCDGFVNGFNNKIFLSNIDTVVLASYRPFHNGNNMDRFKLFSVIKKFSPNVEFYILGNYYQMDHKKIKTTCLNLMKQYFSDASVCAKFSAQNNPIKEKKLLKNKFFEPVMKYNYISLFDLLKDKNYPIETNGVPFMFDHTHLSKSFVEFIATEIITYDGNIEVIQDFKKYMKTVK